MVQASYKNLCVGRGGRGGGGGCMCVWLNEEGGGNIKASGCLHYFSKLSTKGLSLYSQEQLCQRGGWLHLAGGEIISLDVSVINNILN